MDFGFDEAQQEVQALARRILEDKVTDSLLRDVESRGGDRFDRDTWTALAEAARESALAYASSSSRTEADHGGFAASQRIREQPQPAPLHSPTAGLARLSRFSSRQRRPAHRPIAACASTPT